MSDSNTEDPVYKTGAPLYKAGPGHAELKKGTEGIFERQDDWSGVAYFYLDRREDNLPPIPSPTQRMDGMERGNLDQVQ